MAAPAVVPAGRPPAPDAVRQAFTDAAGLVAADATALPFQDASVLAGVAMHVLYLVTDPLRALAELFRVVRPCGVIVVGTSAADDKTLLQQLLIDAFEGLASASRCDAFNVHRRFELVMAVAAMRQVTTDVTVRELRSEIRLAIGEPLIAYIDSLRWFYTGVLRAGEWPRVMARVRDSVAWMLTLHGSIRIPTHTGVVIGQSRARPGTTCLGRGPDGTAGDGLPCRTGHLTRLGVEADCPGQSALRDRLSDANMKVLVSRHRLVSSTATCVASAVPKMRR